MYIAYYIPRLQLCSGPSVYYRFGIPNRYAMIIPLYLYTPHRRAGLVFTIIFLLSFFNLIYYTSHRDDDGGGGGF